MLQSGRLPGIHDFLSTAPLWKYNWGCPATDSLPLEPLAIDPMQLMSCFEQYAEFNWFESENKTT